MPWVTIVVWLVSYLLSYSKTKDAGKSALLATGAAAAAYYTIEPTNEDSLWGDEVGNLLGLDEASGDEAISGTAATPSSTVKVGTTTSGTVGALSSLGSTAITSTADVAKSWGATGTLGFAAGATALSSVDSKWLWVGGGLLAFLLLAK